MMGIQVMRIRKEFLSIMGTIMDKLIKDMVCKGFLGVRPWKRFRVV